MAGAAPSSSVTVFHGVSSQGSSFLCTHRKNRRISLLSPPPASSSSSSSCASHSRPRTPHSRRGLTGVASSRRTPLQRSEPPLRSSLPWAIRSRRIFCAAPRDSLLHKDRTDASELKLQEILQRIGFALGVDGCSLDAHFTAKGRQTCFGLDGDWQLSWCLDGRFYEHFDSEEMEFQYGFDGKESPWHADTKGHVTDLELDNSEACLLGLWIRTGYWVTEQGQERLLVKIEAKNSSYEDSVARDEIWLSISLKGKKVETHLSIDSRTWLPRRMELKAFGGIEVWEFIGWENFGPEMRLKFPVSTIFLPAAGGKHLYKVEKNGVSCSQGQQNACLYTHPSSLFLPRDKAHSPCIHLDTSCSPSVKMIPVRSGHHLVSPLIDGVNMGYFIVDTGASGLVISGKKADEVNMDTFGEAFITGIEGNFKTCFRKGKSFQLGPFTIHNPVFLQAPSDEVVRGVTESISGICGYDIFCQTVVEMASAEFRMSFYDPLLYKPFWPEVKWEEFYMLDNTPHAVAKFKGQSGIFMLDTGAGGIDIIFHKRAVEMFNLNACLDWRGVAEVTGLGAGSKGIKVEQGILDSVELAGHTFSRVRTLHFSADEQALDISIYTSGVLCGELILKHLAIFDYQSRRFALVPTR